LVRKKHFSVEGVGAAVRMWEMLGSNLGRDIRLSSVRYFVDFLRLSRQMPE
jgi:hypothetical protein